MAAFQCNDVSTSMRQYTTSHHEIQIDSGQDMVRQGIDGGGRPWTVVCDGHGKGEVIRCLREADWNDMIAMDNPIMGAKTLVDSLAASTFNDGSTISLVKVYENRIECSWMGDSEIRIYRDGIEVWRSPRHGYGNTEELAMDHACHLPRSPSWTLGIVDDETMTMDASAYFHYGSGIQTDSATGASRVIEERLAMTRALGHNNRVHPVEQNETINIQTPGVWKVIVASDGLWDMVHDADASYLAAPDIDAETITAWCRERWTKEWDYIFPRPEPGVSSDAQATKQRIPVGDDVCVGVTQFEVKSQ